ncbi:unnamed protein product [Didymodactylos carnosus]|nr:unnamed protein product [Didymodactylos carnosus]
MSILNDNYTNYNNNLLWPDSTRSSSLSYTPPCSDNQQRIYSQNSTTSSNQLCNIPQKSILIASNKPQQQQTSLTNLINSNGFSKSSNVANNKQMNDLVIKVPSATSSSSIIPNGQEQQNIYSLPNSSQSLQIVLQQPSNSYIVQHHPQTVYVGQHSQQQISQQPTQQYSHLSSPTMNLGSVNNNTGIRSIMTNTSSIVQHHHQPITVNQTVLVPSSITLDSSNEYQQRNSPMANSIHSIVQNSNNNTSYSQIISRQIMNSNEPTPLSSGIANSSASPALQRCLTPIRPQPCSSASSISSQSSTFSSSSSNSSHVDIQYQQQQQQHQSSRINIQPQIHTNKVRLLRPAGEQQPATIYFNSFVSQANSTSTINGQTQLPPSPFTSKISAPPNQQQTIAPKVSVAPVSTATTTISTITVGQQSKVTTPAPSSSQTDKPTTATRPSTISLPPSIIPSTSYDDCYFARYERDVNNYDGMKFSYLIDDLTSYNKYKRTIRYVSLNDL